MLNMGKLTPVLPRGRKGIVFSVSFSEFSLEVKEEAIALGIKSKPTPTVAESRRKSRLLILFFS